jgi:predicted amidohydrolase
VTELRVVILQTPAPDFMEQDASWAEWLRRLDDAVRDEPDLLVLPEASYPAWFLAAAAATTPSIPDATLIAALADRAVRHRVYIAAGLVLGRPHTPENAAVLISPDGIEVARASEISPAPWFRAGRGPSLATVAGLPVALVAGADLQDPRGAQAIADGGVSLVISTGAPRGAMRGGQPRGDAASFVVPARAAETGAWVISAGRVGVEAEAVSYVGGAGIASREGRWIVRAPADRPGVVLHTIEVAEDAAGVSRVPNDHASPFIAGGANTARLRAAALALDPNPSVVDLMESVRASVRAAAALGARLVVLPDLSGADPRAVTQAETLPLIEAVSAETRVVVVATLAERAHGMLHRTISVVEDGRTLDSHRQSALGTADLRAGFRAGTEAPPVVVTAGAGRIGLLAGDEGLVPAAAASLVRRGAQVIAWSTGQTVALEPIARTRAWEQRVGVVAAGSVAAGAFVVEAGGQLVAASSEGEAMLAQGLLDQSPTGPTRS